ncbi:MULTISPECIES: iron-containing alcohol dehydrogenase [Paenibacillus]|uniref:Iron-containing alcohol dehydrogenase n=1 Tax=Paenibacillus violae TaxID=3077234 RepID=A0ABU3R5C2_9BACL|nr:MULTISPECIES: iron-containing alcohol dehydrogenase [Paenibacillus]MDU0199466.1 iron-containing alcohol dehydrogenase [Paenibacillus sp. PFR10]MEC0267276.1 iron-containing alcohol dehydrogenase [Paenibacillus anseongense]
MEKFEFYNPTKLLFGKGQLSSLKKEIPAYGKRVLLLYGGGSMKKSGLYDKVIHELKEIGATVVELGGVEPNPRLTTVKKGINLIKENQLDFILAVGGGSVLDCAKAIAAGVPYDGDVWDIVLKKVKASSNSVPIGTVLTLAATGSEMNGNSVITNWEENEKKSFNSIHVYPRFSILDPELTFSVPRDQTVYGIVDIMSHVFEQYFHASSHAPLQERIGEAILRTVIETAPKLVNDLNNYEYREVMLLNGTLALNGLTAMGVKTDWATHYIEHAVSAVHDIPHGGGLAILFPRWMEHVAAVRPEKVAQLGVRVFDLDPAGKTDTQLAAEAIESLVKFWTSIGAPTKLSDYGIDDKEIELMTERAMLADQIGNYVPLSNEDVRKILRNSL